MNHCQIVFFFFFYFFYRGGFCHAHPHHSHQSPSKTAKHWINVIVALWRFHLHDKLRQIVVGCCSTFSNLCIKCDVNEPFCVHQLNDKLIHFLANFSHSQCRWVANGNFLSFFTFSSSSSSSFRTIFFPPLNHRMPSGYGFWFSQQPVIIPPSFYCRIKCEAKMSHQGGWQTKTAESENCVEANRHESTLM